MDEKGHVTSQHIRDLQVKGYTVVENAVSSHKQYKEEVTQWLTQCFGEGNAPYSVHSLVRGYNVGHLDTAWKVRLDVKKNFEEVWKDDQLLTSIDALAIGQPPEMGKEEFDSEHMHWLHDDQCAARKGLHSYQGAVYLETADVDDWTFEVMEGSHQHLEAFYHSHQDQALKSVFRGMHRMRPDDIAWFADKDRLNIQCPDLKLKKQAYQEMLMTTHWASDDVAVMDSRVPSYGAKSRMPPLTSLPPTATRAEAKYLAGVLPYPRRKSDSPTTRPPRPQWDFRFRPDMAERLREQKSWVRPRIFSMMIALIAVVVVILAAFIDRT